MILSPGQRRMVLATLLFTVMGALVKHLRPIPAHEVVFFRALVSLVACGWMLRRAGRSPWGTHKGLLLARGAAGTAALLLYFYTLQHMPLATAVTVQYLSPLFTVALSGLWLREAASGRQWVGFVACFAGVALLKGFDPRVGWAVLGIGIAAALLSALAYNLVRRLAGLEDPLVVVLYFPLVTLPVVGPYTLTHWVWPRGWQWVWLVAVGLLTQAAQVQLTRAYHLEPASRVSHLSYLGSVFALGIGYLAFGEALPPGALVGLGLVLLGLVQATRAGSTK
ncbi:DMT family transporter [Deferrisoma sp.]